MKDKNYEWFVSHDLDKYKGRWIAIVDEKVVSSSDNAKVALDEAKKKYPGKRPVLAKLPKGEALILNE